MDLTEGSETSAKLNLTPGENPKENTQDIIHVMPSTDRRLELKAKTSVAQTDSQPYVYAKGLIRLFVGNLTDLYGTLSINRCCS
jgi:hypothetical protein